MKKPLFKLKHKNKFFADFQNYGNITESTFAVNCWSRGLFLNDGSNVRLINFNRNFNYFCVV